MTETTPPYRYLDGDNFCLSARLLPDLNTGGVTDTLSITIEGSDEPQSVHVPAGDVSVVAAGIVAAAGQQAAATVPAPAPTDQAAEKPRVTASPDGGVILHLPEITYLDTQVWSVDIGLTDAGLEALRAALLPAPAAPVSDDLLAVQLAPLEAAARAAALTEAAGFLRNAHFDEGLSVQEIGTAMRHWADRERADAASAASSRSLEPAGPEFKEDAGTLKSSGPGRVAGETQQPTDADVVEAHELALSFALNDAETQQPLVSTVDKAAALGLTDTEYRARSHAAAVATVRAAIPGMYAHVGFRVEDVLNEAGETQQPETQAPVRHAPGKVILCPDCRAKGYAVCMEPAAVCEGFVWIGQSFATCDRCGQPAWDHAGRDMPVEGAGPFDTRRTVRPWEPGEADRIRAKWAPAAVSQPETEA